MGRIFNDALPEWKLVLGEWNSAGGFELSLDALVTSRHMSERVDRAARSFLSFATGEASNKHPQQQTRKRKIPFTFM